MPLSESEKQKIIAHWQTAFETGQKLTDMSQMKYYHTKQNVDIYDLKGDSTTVIRGDTIVDDLEDLDKFIDYFTSPTVEMKKKIQSEAHRVENLEEWKENDGSKWHIQYSSFNPGGLFH